MPVQMNVRLCDLNRLQVPNPRKLDIFLSSQSNREEGWGLRVTFLLFYQFYSICGPQHLYALQYFLHHKHTNIWDRVSGELFDG